MAIQTRILNVVLTASLLLLISSARALPTPSSADLATSLPSSSNHISVERRFVLGSSPRNGTWMSLGCYDDARAERSMHEIDLTNSYGAGSTSTIEYCQSQCVTTGTYIFAAVEKGSKCYCAYGDQVIADHLMAEKLDDEECDMPCEDDGSQTCGGDTQVYLYKFVSNTATEVAARSVASTQYIATTVTRAPVTTVPATTAAATVTAARALTPRTSTSAGWTEVGCLVDNITHTLLSYQLSIANSSTTLSVSKCRQGCLDGGYDLAGVEWGLDCWCGMSNKTGNFIEGGNSSNCHLTCLGSPVEMCDGYLSMFVYKLDTMNFTRTESISITSTVTSMTLITLTVDTTTSSPGSPSSFSSSSLPSLPSSPASKIAIAASPTPTSASMPAPFCSIWHSVLQGENCWLIWTRYNLTEAQFRTLNPTLVFPDCLIHPGDIICLVMS